MAAPIEIGATMQHLVLHCPSREAVLVVDRLDGRLEERWGAEGASVVGRVEGGWRRCGAVLGVMRWASTQEAFLILAPPSPPVAVLPPLPTLQVAADAQVNIHRIQNVDVISFITARPMSENEVNATDVGEVRPSAPTDWSLENIVALPFICSVFSSLARKWPHPEVDRITDGSFVQISRIITGVDFRSIGLTVGVAGEGAVVGQLVLLARRGHDAIAAVVACHGCGPRGLYALGQV